MEMATGRGAPPSLDPRAWTAERFAYRAYWRKRAQIRRNCWTRTFADIGTLYSDQGDLVEEQLIRAACEEVGLPMGYGRLGQIPEQLPWSIALSSDDSYDADMADDITTVTIVDDAEVPPEKVAELAAEVSKWEMGETADRTWKDAPEAIIARPGNTVVVRRRAKKKTL